MAVRDDILQNDIRIKNKSTLQPPIAPHEDTPQPPIVLDGNTQLSKEPPAKPDQQIPIQQPMNYTELYKTLHKVSDDSSEGMKEEEKRERSKAAILALTDTINAINELYQVSRGAPLSPQVSLSDTNKKRYAERMAQREARRQAYLAGLEKAGFADIKANIEAQGRRENMKHDRDLIGYKGRLEAAASQAQRDFNVLQAEREAENQERLLQMKLQANARENAQDRANARAIATSKGGSSSGGGSKKHKDVTPFIFNGETYEINNDALMDNSGRIAELILSDLQDPSRISGFDSMDKKERQAAINNMQSALQYLKSGIGMPGGELSLQGSPAKTEDIYNAIIRYAAMSPGAMKLIRQLDAYYRTQPDEIDYKALGFND